jgi:hypothetical protein
MSDVKHVYTAINQVVATMAGEGLAKSRNNQAQGFRFRGIDDVYNALARVVADAKLLILPRVRERWVVERPSKSGGVQTFTTLLIDFDLVSAVDGSMHTITTIGEAQDSADKSSNKSMSAAMKYACLMSFQIPTEGDNDADASHGEKMPAGPPPTLEKQLTASLEWIEWEKSSAATLRHQKTMGALSEAWADILPEAKKAPNGTAKRLAAVKDDCKAKLSAPPEQRA